MVDLKEKPFGLDDGQIAWVKETLGKMSLEEKAGQLFLPVFTAGKASVEEELKEIAFQPGGFYLRAQESDKLRETIREIQKYYDIPLLIAADLDRGPCNHIVGAPNWAVKWRLRPAGIQSLPIRRDWRVRGRCSRWA